MTTSQTIEKLVKMRMYGFRDALDEQRLSVEYQDMSFDERLSFLVEKEFIRRENNKISRRLSMAKLKQKGTIEDIIYEKRRGLHKSQIMELSQCYWIEQQKNIIITGATGVGKTFLSCALCNKACKLGHSSLYLKAGDMISKFKMAEAEGTLQELLIKFAKIKLIILDEWLREPLEPRVARIFLDFFDDRYSNSSCILISQIPVSNWYEQIKEPTIADAILDRIIHSAYKINIEGESLRKQNLEAL